MTIPTSLSTIDLGVIRVKLRVVLFAFITVKPDYTARRLAQSFVWFDVATRSSLFEPE
ncbi:hypothetical protein [Salinivibrio kushneri]|uniref:Uncharacterized protein n=1 Tax=Salinivibrio kushneri TaxID=1908198 RepID=A0AA47KII3_9GAMM|nr:hypothetical protein [Salinivibrio kushneri]WBA07561.1 hypothetical protein N8M53_06690 [Salinivibrio kushneri]